MNITRYYKGLALMLMTTTGLALTSCKDQPDKYEIADGRPTVNYIRCLSTEIKGTNDAADTHYTTGELVESASPQSTLALIGSNLRSVYEIWFNDKQAILNTSYITDNALLVDVPRSVPRKVTDKIYLITQSKDTVTVDFKVVIPAPEIQKMTCEYANIGDKVTFTGNYFVYDPKFPLTASFTSEDGTSQIPVTIEAGDVSDDFTSVNITIPEGAGRGPITMTSIYGTAQSPFYYLDNRGMLFDFETIADGGTGLFSQGWKVRDPIEDENSLPNCRHYITIGDGEAELAEDGDWQDVPFRFDFWCGDWNSPQNVTDAPGAALFNVADFSKWESMALKFEMCIPSTNAWSSGAMQICFQPIEQVTLSGNPVAGYKEVGNANHAAFDGSKPDTKWGSGDWGRAFYRPWMTTGEFHTDGKWITVTVPLSDLTLDKDGKPASIAPTKATDFASLTMFLLGGGKGKACKALLRIDNIRVVPYK